MVAVPSRAKTFGVSILYFLVFFFFQVITSVIFGGIAVVGHQYSQQQADAAINLAVSSNAYIITIISVFLSLAVYALILYSKKQDIEELLGFNKLATVPIIRATLLGLSLSAIFSFILSVSSAIKIFPEYKYLIQTISTSNTILPLITAILVAPVFEELLFRGLILNELRNRFSLISAVLIQSLLFGLYQGNLLQLLFSFIAGIVFSFVYVWTKSLLPGIAMHIGFRVIGFLLALGHSYINWIVYTFILLGGLALAASMLSNIYQDRIQEDPLEITDEAYPS